MAIETDVVVNMDPFTDVRVKDTPKKETCIRKIRRRTGAYLEELWELSESIRQPMSEIVELTGIEKHGKNELKMIYIGSGENFNFITNLAYEKYSFKKLQEKKFSINATRWVKKYSDNTDLTVVDLELFYCKLFDQSEWISIPQWIRQKLTIPDDWKDVVGNFRKNTKKTDLRKIRKYGLTYRFTRDEEAFNHFYDMMYVPYLKKRFTNEVLIEPKWKVLRQCRKGMLMHILRQEQIVAAAVLHCHEGRLAYVWVGVPDDISEEMFRGAFSGLFYYTILYGFNTGCDEIDFLGSRPLLNDGLFRYKRKWGAYVEDSPVPRGDILIKPNNLNKAVLGFFANNYFIARNGKELCGLLVHDKGRLQMEDIKNYYQQYSATGINGIKIFCPHGHSEDAVLGDEIINKEIILQEKFFELDV